MRSDRQHSRTIRTIETLERRLLMATINVADFGAVPDDGHDDTAAIRAAIRASSDGDTIVFSGGVFDIGSEIALYPNRTYTGGAILRKDNGYVFTVHQRGENITIDGLIFDGAGITNGSVRADNVTIRNSIFRNINGGGEEKNGIFWGAGARNSQILNNRFINIQGHNGVYGFGTWDNTTISGNYFENVMEGIHLAYKGENLLVANNTGRLVKRMAIELQGYDAVNTIVENNHFVEWHDQRYHGSFAYSIMNWGTGTIVRNNYASSGEAGKFDPRRNEAMVGIEFSGNNGLVEGNVIDGFKEGLHIVQADNAVVRNNTFRWQSEVAIWITGVASARDVRIHDNLIIDAYRGFMSHSGAGAVVENNTFLSTNPGRSGRGAVANVPNITYRNNRFQNLKSIFEERDGLFRADGNIAYNSGYATGGFLARRGDGTPLTIGDIALPGPVVPGTPPLEQAPAGEAAGTGLLGQYFVGRDFAKLGFARIDRHVNFDWGTGTPAAGLGADDFSIRWSGQVEAPISGEYAFHVTADDGVRLWVNGELIIDRWHDQAAAEHTGRITLEAGQKYNIKMEYYEAGGESTARLRWSAPGIAKQPIPVSRLYAPQAAAPAKPAPAPVRPPIAPAPQPPATPPFADAAPIAPISEPAPAESGPASRESRVNIPSGAHAHALTRAIGALLLRGS